MRSKLFGSSGVRGLVKVDLTPILAARIGLAAMTFSKAKMVLVARDTRVSGSMLKSVLVSGLLVGARVKVEGESLKVAKEIMEKGVALVKKLIREMK